MIDKDNNSDSSDQDNKNVPEKPDNQGDKKLPPIPPKMPANKLSYNQLISGMIATDSIIYQFSFISLFIEKLCCKLLVDNFFELF